MERTKPEPDAGARALTAFAVLLASSTLLVRLADLDLFSHIAVGRWILAHHAIPTTDPFSFASEGPFRYTEALADVTFASVDALFGTTGLGLLQIVFGVAILSLCLMQRGARGTASSRALVAALVVTASFAAMTLKPQLFSYVLFASVLLIVDRAPSWPPRRLLLLPLLFVAWANLHRAGVFGIAALCAAGVGFALDPKTRDHARMMVPVTIASALALLVNSGGIYYVTSAFDVVGRASFHQLIDEWRPLTWLTVREHHPMIVPLLALALGERAWTRRRVDAELLVLVVSMGVATKGARLLPFVALAAAAPAVRALDGLGDFVARRARPVFFRALVALVALAMPVVSYAASVPAGYRGLGLCEAVVPVELSRFLATNRPPGNLFHSFNFGGYFVYALAPETKVLIDGRNDSVYTDAFFRDVNAAETDPSVFARLDQRYSFAVAAFRWSSFGDRRGAFLSHSPDWVLVYWDDLSVVFAHRTRARAMADALGYRTFHVDDAFALAATPHGGPQDALFMSELARTVRDAPRSARAHDLYALALRARGATEAASREAALTDALAKEKGFAIREVEAAITARR